MKFIPLLGSELMFESLAAYILRFGYAGIFLLMALESSFFPFPSEIIIIPAAYLAYKGKMSLVLIWFAGVLGSLVGALFNYFIALYLGRPFLEKYGKILLINKKHLRYSENFFRKYGNITTFFGRLLPLIRQYISLPAGISKMPLRDFILFTLLGAGIWVAFLELLGYYLGMNFALVKKNIFIFTIVLIIIIALYFFYMKKVLLNEKN